MGRLARRLLVRYVFPGRPARAVPTASPRLRALATAALALPGLAGPAQAEEVGEMALHYGWYQEAVRDLGSVLSAYDPLHADSLSAEANLGLGDRLKLRLGFSQDTWSGATPIATAPSSLYGNRSSALDGVSSASPYVTGGLYFDSQMRPLNVDQYGTLTGGLDNKLVHTLSSASPETRRQFDTRLTRDWEAFSLDVGLGVSDERDFGSRWLSVGGRWDMNNRLTTLGLGLSHTRSDIAALLDHDTQGYVYRALFQDQLTLLPSGGARLDGERRDWNPGVSLTQVLNRQSRFQTSLSMVRSSGYLENPYKAVEIAFLDPEQQSLAPPGGYYGEVRAFLEQRPDKRRQWVWDNRYLQYLPGLKAAVSLGYRHNRDDWGIRAHTLEGEWRQNLGGGWRLTPRVRYYSQSAADFYVPYLISNQAYVTNHFDPDTGDYLGTTYFDPGLLPANFSSDARLAAYGALSAGLSLSKRLDDNLVLEAGLDYTRQGGNLKWGGGGEASFADQKALMFSVTLRTSLEGDGADADPGGDHEHHTDHDHGARVGQPAPAGVDNAHFMARPGALMLGYRYDFSRQDGNIRHGSDTVGDAQVLARGCRPAGDCSSVPGKMHMGMHMLELMYAPADWLNVMVMTHYHDMSMGVRTLDGAVFDPHSAHGDHGSGGLGDSEAGLLMRWLATPRHELIGALGLGIPTGATDLTFRRTHQQESGFLDYGMQLGSGTWDLSASLTWLNHFDGWTWGAQAGLVRHLEKSNDQGYALGDQFHASTWASLALSRRWSISARLLYSEQGMIQGEFDDTHPLTNTADFPGNYGGRFWDGGLGFTYRNGKEQFAAEWLQPLAGDYNGYQAGRTGALSLSWQHHF